MGSMQRAGQSWPVFLVVETYDGDVSRDDARQNSPVTVTSADPYYTGSLTIDADLLAADIPPSGSRRWCWWINETRSPKFARSSLRVAKPDAGGILDWVPFVPVFQCQQHPAARSFVRCEHYSTLSAGREQRAMAIGKWAC